MAAMGGEEEEITHYRSESESKSSELTSLAPPPRPPSFSAQNPSRDEPSHVGNGGCTPMQLQAMPVYRCSPSEAEPPSWDAHGRLMWFSTSSFLRFPDNFRDPGLWKRNGKGWPECADGVTKEDVVSGDGGLSRRCKIVNGVVTLFILATLFCLVLWGAARPYKPQVVVKNLAMNHFYAGNGRDHNGVSTKLVTLNCTLDIDVYNPSTMFGIDVTSGPIRLLYSDISIGVGQVNRYYQPRKSHQVVTAFIHGKKVALHGARGRLSMSTTGRAVPWPLTLDFDLTSQGYIYRLLRVMHKTHVTCPIVAAANKTKPIQFSSKACAVYSTI